MDLLYKMSGLHFACREGLHHLIHDLSTHMPQSLNVTSGHASPMTPLQFASHNGHELVVRELLSNVSLNVNAKDGKGRTALMYAVKSGHQEIVQLLRNSEGIDADTADSCGWRVIDFIEMSDSEG